MMQSKLQNVDRERERKRVKEKNRENYHFFAIENWHRI